MTITEIFAEIDKLEEELQVTPKEDDSYGVTCSKIDELKDEKSRWLDNALMKLRDERTKKETPFIL
jgi:hypothetical protein